MVKLESLRKVRTPPHKTHPIDSASSSSTRITTVRKPSRTPTLTVEPSDSVSSSTKNTSTLMRSTPLPTSHLTFQQRRAEIKELLQAKHHSGSVRFRQEEARQIRQFSHQCKIGKKGIKFMMVTGPPGLGKTLTVTTALQESGIFVIAANSISVDSLTRIQGLIYQTLLHKTAPKNLSTHQLRQSIRVRKCQPAIVYLEEMDAVLKKPINDYSSQFFSLFEDQKIKLGLIGVSNNLDFLNRYCRKGEFRLLKTVSSLVFSPYNRSQIQALLMSRVDQLGTECGVRVIWDEAVMRFTLSQLERDSKGDMRYAGEFLKQLVLSVFNNKVPAEVATQPEVIELHVGIVDVKLIVNRVEEKRKQFVHSQSLPLRLVMLALVVILRRQEGCYVTQRALLEMMSRACSRRGLHWSKQSLHGWLLQLQSISLVSLSIRSGETRVVLQVNSQYVQSAFESVEKQKRYFE